MILFAYGQDEWKVSQYVPGLKGVPIIISHLVTEHRNKTDFSIKLLINFFFLKKEL